MAQLVTVAKVGAIEEGRGEAFKVGDRLIAVFKHEGQYYAIDDTCPHMGASLSAVRLTTRESSCAPGTPGDSRSWTAPGATIHD